MKRLTVLSPLAIAVALAGCGSDTSSSSSAVPPPGPTSTQCLIVLSGNASGQFTCTATLTADPSGARRLVILPDDPRASDVRADIVLPGAAGPGNYGGELSGTVTAGGVTADASAGRLQLTSVDPAHGFYAVNLGASASGYTMFQARF